jgi:hypothetical protein
LPVEIDFLYIRHTSDTQKQRSHNREMTAPIIHLTGLTDREACVDAVVRFLQGLDDNDGELIESAFTEDIFFDLQPCGIIGIPFGTISTREKVVPHLLGTVGVLDSLHQLTNSRVHLKGDGTAFLTAAALAQHYRPKDGPQPDKRDSLLMGNRYKADLVKGPDGVWKISTFEISCQWCEGSMSVFKP